jgi:hypothetical protein
MQQQACSEHCDISLQEWPHTASGDNRRNKLMWQQWQFTGDNRRNKSMPRYWQQHRQLHKESGDNQRNKHMMNQLSQQEWERKQMKQVDKGVDGQTMASAAPTAAGGSVLELGATKRADMRHELCLGEHSIKSCRQPARRHVLTTGVPEQPEEQIKLPRVSEQNRQEMTPTEWEKQVKAMEEARPSHHILVETFNKGPLVLQRPWQRHKDTQNVQTQLQ